MLIVMYNWYIDSILVVISLKGARRETLHAIDVKELYNPTILNGNQFFNVSGLLVNSFQSGKCYWNHRLHDRRKRAAWPTSTQDRP